MMRWIRRLILGGFLLGLAIITSLSALVATEEGSRWALTRLAKFLPASVGQLELGEMRGNLLTGLDLAYFDFQQSRDNQLQQHYRAEDVSFRWQPLALLYSAVSVQSLHADKIILHLPPAAEQTEPRPFDWPSFALPLRFELGDILLQNIEVIRDEARLVELQRVSGSLSLGTFNFRMTDLAVITPTYGVTLDGRIGLRFPYAADLDVQWYFQQAAADADSGEEVAAPLPLYFEGQGQLRGDVNEQRFNHTLTAPFAIKSKGTFRPGFEIVDEKLTSAPDARITNEWHEQALLQRWFVADKPVPVTSAKLTLTGWYDNYQAQLSGDLVQPDVGELNVSAKVSGNLQAVDIERLEINRVNKDKSVVPLQVATSGRVAWSPTLEWGLTLQAQQVNPAIFLPDWPGNMQLALRVEGEYRPPADQAQASDLQLRFQDLDLSGSLRGLAVSGKGDLAFDGERWLSEQLRVTLGANQLNLSGSISEQLDLQWRLEVPLLTQIDPQFTGSLSSRGRVQGTLSEPLIDVTARARDLRWQDYALEQLDLHLQPSAGHYELALDAQALSLNEQYFPRITLTGSGSMAQHLLHGSIENSDIGQLDFDLESQYSDARWQGRFTDLNINVSEIPPLQLASSEWINASAERVEIGQQCLTTRSFRDWRRTRNDPAATDTPPGDGDVVVDNNNEPELSNDQADQANEAPARLCLNGVWDSEKGAELQASLVAVPLRLARAWLKPEVTLGGVIEGDLSFNWTKKANPTNVFDGMVASLQLQTRGGELRHRVIEEEPSVYVWRSAQLQAELKDSQLEASALMDWAEYGDLNAGVTINMAREDITGSLTANFNSLSPFEALIPLVNDVSGRLTADINVSGKLDKPDIAGDLRLLQGTAKIPSLGLELTSMALSLEGRSSGRMDLRASAKSGDGTLNIAGDLQGLGTPDWQANGQLRGENFLILNQSQLNATLTPSLDLLASEKEIRVSGDARIPYARASIKTLPAGATKVSKDVVVINDPTMDEMIVAGKPLFMNINLELGEDVVFSGFGLNGKLRGKINILQSPPRALLTTGYVSIEDGEYKAYGQELEIERGRLLFQGPYDNPGLDILAVRETPEYEVGLEVSGTIQQPKSTIRPPEGMSESESMAILLTGKPLNEASAADAYVLLSAVSGLGMSDGPMITEEIAQTLRVDEFTINSDDGFKQSELWVGKYLSPRLFVRYIVGLFDQVSSVGVTYEITDKLRVEAESGEIQSVDLIYKIER